MRGLFESYSIITMHEMANKDGEWRNIAASVVCVCACLCAHACAESCLNFNQECVTYPFTQSSQPELSVANVTHQL